MSFLLKISDRLDAITHRVGRLGSWLILPLIAIIMFDVLSRKFQFIQQLVLNSPLYEFMSPTKLQELEWHLHAAIFLLAYGMTYLLNGHVRVDVLREGFSRRRQGWIELIGLLLLALPYLAVLLIYGWDFVQRSYVSGEGSDALTGLPHRWVIKSILLIGVAILLAAVLSTLIKLLAYLFGTGPVADAAAKRLQIFPQDEAPAAPTYSGQEQGTEIRERAA